MGMVRSIPTKAGKPKISVAVPRRVRPIPAQGGTVFRSATGSKFSPGSLSAIRIRYLFGLATYFTACAVREAGVLTLHF